MVINDTNKKRAAIEIRRKKNRESEERGRQSPKKPKTFKRRVFNNRRISVFNMPMTKILEQERKTKRKHSIKVEKRKNNQKG